MCSRYLTDDSRLLETGKLFPFGVPDESASRVPDQGGALRAPVPRTTGATAFAGEMRCGSWA